MKRLFVLIFAAIVAISMFVGCAQDTVEEVNPTFLSNEFIGITVPDDWPERIYVEISDYRIKICQKAAYESFGGGWLGSITASGYY